MSFKHIIHINRQNRKINKCTLNKSLCIRLNSIKFFAFVFFCVYSNYWKNHCYFLYMIKMGAVFSFLFFFLLLNIIIKYPLLACHSFNAIFLSVFSHFVEFILFDFLITVFHFFFFFFDTLTYWYLGWLFSKKKIAVWPDPTSLDILFLYLFEHS